MESELRRAIGESWRNSRARTLLAPLVLLDGHEAEALRLLDEAIALDPRNLRAHAYRGQIELGGGQARAALRDFEGEIRLQGVDAFLARHMGLAYARMADRGRARAWYRRALEIDPADRVARDSLAALEAGMGH